MLTEKQLSEALTASEMIRRREEEQAKQEQRRARLNAQEMQRTAERNAWKAMLNSGVADPEPTLDLSDISSKAERERREREEKTTEQFREFIRNLKSDTEMDVSDIMAGMARRLETDNAIQRDLSESKNAEAARRSARERSRQRDREAYARMLKDL